VATALAELDDASAHRAAAHRAGSHRLHAASEPDQNEIDGYDFEAPTRFDRLFTGIGVERPKSLDPNDVSGTEDIGPGDTFDADMVVCWSVRMRKT
jgi:hypothetical protein